MEKRRSISIVLVFCCLALLTSAVEAATITSCTFDKDAYQQGDTGVMSVTIYNDKSSTIRVTELTAAIDYFYSDGTAYLQTFFTNATLPVEISVGQSSVLYIPFSLPTNIASGYIQLFVRARTEVWNSQSQNWMASDTGIYEPVLFVESPYKEQLEEQQVLNQQLQEQIDSLQDANTQLQQQLEEQQVVNEQLQQQLDAQQDINAQLQLQLDLQENEIAQLNQQLADLGTTLGTYMTVMIALGIVAFSLAAVIMILIALNRRSRAIPSNTT